MAWGGGGVRKCSSESGRPIHFLSKSRLIVMLKLVTEFKKKQNPVNL